MKAQCYHHSTPATPHPASRVSRIADTCKRALRAYWNVPFGCALFVAKPKRSN